MKLKKTIIAAASAVAIVAGSQAAFASTTLSVGGTTSPAGDVAVNGTATSSLVFETNYGVVNTCLTGGSVGTVKRGASGPIGTQVGTINTMLFNNCTATDLLFNVEARQKVTPANWTIHTLEVPAKGATTVKVEIRNIDAQLNNVGAAPWTCALNVTGKVEATINLATDKLIINTPALSGGLSKTNPLLIDALPTSGAKPNTTLTSCGGEVQDGDVASMSGTFQLDKDLAIV